MVDPGSNCAGGLRAHEAARLRLARLHVGDGATLAEAFRSATEVAARTLEVERVGIWLFVDDHRALRCESLFELSTNTHSEGALLSAADFPNYCRSLEERRDIPASSARSNELTNELAACYLEPLGIVSMLDAPILRAGEVAGVICHEHTAVRRWTDEERDFAAAVADAAARLLEADALSDAEARLRAQEACLTESRKMEALGRLAAGVAHDFRNILTVVIGFADEIRRASTTPRVADAARQILNSAERGAALIKDLLAFGREESHAPRVLDVGEVVDSMVKVLCTAVSSSHPIDVHCQRPIGSRARRSLPARARVVEPGAERGRRDAARRPDRHRRARGADREGPGKQGTYVLLEVSDSGTGMDAATRYILRAFLHHCRPAREPASGSPWFTASSSTAAASCKSTASWVAARACASSCPA